MIIINDIEHKDMDAITLRIPLAHPSKIDKLLTKLRLKKTSRDFVIKPACIGTVGAISQLITPILPNGLRDDKDLLAISYETLQTHQDTFCQIIAQGIYNRKGMAPEWMVRYLKDNLTIADLFEALQVVTKQLNLSAFIHTIILLKGINILKKESVTTE